MDSTPTCSKCLPPITALYFEGTEETCLDWMHNCQRWQTQIADGVKIHSGFLAQVQPFLRMLEIDLLEHVGAQEFTQPIVLIGYSLGGAIASVFAHHLFSTHEMKNGVELITIGSPKVGNKK